MNYLLWRPFMKLCNRFDSQRNKTNWQILNNKKQNSIGQAKYLKSRVTTFEEICAGKKITFQCNEKLENMVRFFLQAQDSKSSDTLFH